MPGTQDPMRAKLGSTFQGLDQRLKALENWTQQQAPRIPAVSIPLTGAAWITPTLINSWVTPVATYAPVAYLKDPLGFVHIRGSIKSGATSTVAFVLPAGYRPVASEQFPITGPGSTQTSSAVIDASGNVTIFSPTGTSGVWITGITFLAEN